MSMHQIVTDLQRKRALGYEGLWSGKNPEVNVTSSNISLLASIGRSLSFGIVAALLSYIGAILLHLSSETASICANVAFNVSFLVGILFPYIIIIIAALWHWQKPDFSQLKAFSFGEKLVANAFLAFLMLLAVKHSYGWLAQHHYWANTPPAKHRSNQGHGHHHAPAVKKVALPELTTITQINIWLGFTGLLSFLGYQLGKQRSALAKTKQQAPEEAIALPFGLWLGESTGRLAKLWHQASLAPNQQVALFNDDAAQNILVLGAIGSGKTTSVIHPLLIQLLDQECGGLIFDIKGDFHKAVQDLSALTQRDYAVIGINATPCNLLAGLSPEMAASFLKSVFILSGANRADNFWLDTATELCRNALGILSYFPEDYSLYGLHHYLFDTHWRQTKTQTLTPTFRLTLDEHQQRLLASYEHYLAQIFDEFDEKVKTGVKATIAQVLAPFNHPSLIDAFCTAHPQSARLEEVLEGHVFLVNLPLAQWGLGAKVVYTLIKLRFFNIMQQRNLQPQWNQQRYVFFLCDEYQDIISASKDGLSDLNFWDKSRSSKTVGIISAQSVSSFYAAIGDRDVANAILQNFRQKLCFRTEDQTTIELMNRLLGTVEVKKKSQTQSTGRTSGGQNSSQHQGNSTTTSLQERPLLDGQFFRTLGTGYVLALLSYGGGACDDVLRVEPYYL